MNKNRSKLLIGITILIVIIIVYATNVYSIKTYEKSRIADVEQLAVEYDLSDAVIQFNYLGKNSKYRTYDLIVSSSDFEKLDTFAKFNFIESLEVIDGKALVFEEIIADGNVYDIFDDTLRKNGNEIYVTTSKQNERNEQEQQKELENKRNNPFVLEDTNLNRDGDYIYYTGYIKNVSDLTFSYIKIKCVYLDKNSNILDTDWTYAVGSEGLSPNERKGFEIMTKYTEGMTQGQLSIMDYQ